MLRGMLGRARGLRDADLCTANMNERSCGPLFASSAMIPLSRPVYAGCFGAQRLLHGNGNRNFWPVKH
jgi:hypothetical protein